MKDLNTPASSHNKILNLLISQIQPPTKKTETSTYSIWPDIKLYSDGFSLGRWSFSLANLKYNLFNPINMINNITMMVGSIASIGAMLGGRIVQAQPEECFYKLAATMTILLETNPSDSQFNYVGHYLLSLSNDSIPEFNNLKIESDLENPGLLNLVYNNGYVIKVKNATLINGNLFSNYTHYHVENNWCTDDSILAQLLILIQDMTIPVFEENIQELVDYILNQNRENQLQKDNWTIAGVTTGAALTLIITCCVIYRYCKLKNAQLNANINSAHHVENQPFLFNGKKSSYQSTQSNNEKNNDKEIKGLNGLACPITKELMKNPVVAADGHTYEKDVIEQWLTSNNTSPVTGKVLPDKKLIPNWAIKKAIDDFKEQNSGAEVSFQT